jgi:hypothetical protein
MANMSVNQRTQFERADLAVPSTGVQVRNRKAVIGFTALAVLILGALSYATVEAIDGWAQAVVLAVIALTAVGAMIALNPLRRG